MATAKKYSPQEAARQREQKVKEITDKLEAGLKALFEGDNYKRYLSVMSKFHSYSFNNTLLITLQKPDATLVAGYKTWQKNFERNVNKGEKGIKIFAPCPYKKKIEQEMTDPETGLPMLGNDGKPLTEEVEVKRVTFRVVPVFDVSQTNGKELPTLGVDELRGEVKDFEKFFGAIKEISPVPIIIEEIEGASRKGYFSRATQDIHIKEGMDEVQTVKTAIHEIAHSMLHSDGDSSEKSKSAKEVEAESVAYTVCQHFGIDTSDYSFSYVAVWGTSCELPELKQSLETIQKTASDIISKIEGKLKGLEIEVSSELDMTEADIGEVAETRTEPRESNIIGNTPYRDIPDKTYIKAAKENLQAIEDFLKYKDIPYSGRITNDTVTFTVSKENAADLQGFVKDMKQAHSIISEHKDRNGKGRISQEEIDRANSVNLPQFLMSQGVELKRVGKEYIMKDHDSVHIADNAYGEKGKWFRFSENVGGGNIDFCEKFLNMSFKEAVEALNGGLDIHYEPPKRGELFDWSKYAAFGAHSAFERIIREKNTEIDTNVKISLSPKAEYLTDYTLEIGIKPCTEDNQLYFAIEYNLRNEKTEKITEVGTYFVDTDDVMIAGHSGHLPDYETFRAMVEANTAKAVDRIRELPKRSEPFTEIKANADSKRVIAYLTKTRGLDYNIVAELLKKGQLVQEEKTGNAAFLIKDKNGKTIGAEKVGTSTDRRFKGVTAGLPEGYGFETVRGKGEYAYFFESAVDMLSFMQIHNDKLDNARLISMMGVKPSIVEATMERYGISPEKVYIGADNDEAGDKFAKGLQSKYPAMKRFLPSDPDCKDWNDQLLKNLSSKALEAAMETPPSARKPTELEKKAVEIAKEYQKLPMQDKINVIAKVFGGTSGEIETTPCTRKWRGTSDISIRFDNGISLFIGNHPTPKAKTAAVQNDCINSALVRYNPEIIGATKEAAIGALRAREAKDNEIAAQKGLKPYTLLNVEFNDCSGEKSDMHMGWYYVTLAVDGEIRAHIETGLNYAISDGKVSEMPARENYFAAGALKEADVDYVFNNVGFSSKSNLYSLPVSAEVRERAEKTLAQRREEQPEKQAKFTIYQLKSGEQYHGVRFENFEANKEKKLNFQDYDLVYTGDWEKVEGNSAEEKLNSIFDEFNIHRPEDFTGHSLSISDVIAVGYDGDPDSFAAHYVDTTGFADMPDFFKEKAREQTIDDVQRVMKTAHDIGVEEAKKANGIVVAANSKAMTNLIAETHFGMKVTNEMLEAFNKGVAEEVHRQTVKEFPDVFGAAKNAPERTMIGNTALRDIANKFFIKMSPDKAKKIADTLDKNGVKFGGFIRDGKATITIDKADLERYQSLTSPDPPKAEKQAETSEKAPVRDAPAVSKTPKRTEQPKKPSVKAKSNTPKPKAEEEKRPSLLGAIAELKKNSSEQSKQSTNEIRKEL